MPTLFTFGHGFSAEALARRLLPLGWRVIGTTRDPDKARRLAASGVEPVLWPGDGDVAGALAAADHLLLSVAPGAEGDPVLAEWGDAIAGHGGLAWIGYLSTTGVYGDHEGDWVDEDTPLVPATRRGAARVAAEAAWTDLSRTHALPLHIFRLAGIYGPGRGPFAKVRSGSARRIIKPGQVFSRIHVEDIAATLLASIERPDPIRAYNVCDDDPAPPQDVIEHAAKLLGLPVPPAIPFEEAELSPMARSFYAESKRVRNDRMKEELGVKLIYPDYRSGLAALLASEDS